MKEKTITACFADLDRYMEAAGKLNASAQASFLNKVFKKAGGIILGHKGKIVKYIGDSVLFYFQDEKNALTAAEEMILNCRFTLNGIETGFKISMSTGPAVVVKLGHPAMNFTDIIGPAVNDAAMNLKKCTPGKPFILSKIKKTRGGKK